MVDSPGMTKRRSLLDLVSIAAVVLGLGIAAYRFIAPFRAVVLMALGRTPQCTFREVLNANQVNRRHSAAAEKIAKGTRRVSEDPMGLELWETPKGRFWTPKMQGELLTFLLAEQERDIYGSGERGIQKGDIVLDCGAHVGTFSRRALEQGASLVVAIEPSPKVVECLRRNLSKEIAEGRAIVYPKGVWDRDGFLPFHIDDVNTGMGSVSETAAGSEIKVPLTTIDAMVAELKLKRVDFIKMDIEGAEVKALTGAKNALSSFHPRMAICVYHKNDDPVQVPIAARNGWPGYRTQCGPCEDQFSRIISETVLFY